MRRVVYQFLVHFQLKTMFVFTGSLRNGIGIVILMASIDRSIVYLTVLEVIASSAAGTTWIHQFNAANESP